MGMDGLSIANTGAIKEQTSAEYANRTEQSIASDAATIARQVPGTGANQRVRSKEEEDENSGNQPNQKNPENDTFEDGLVEEETQEDDTLGIDIEDIENPNKEFYVKLNIKDDIIELYDTSTNRLIETISGSELGELVQKLNMASGIFINKRV